MKTGKPHITSEAIGGKRIWRCFGIVGGERPTAVQRSGLTPSGAYERWRIVSMVREALNAGK